MPLPIENVAAVQSSIARPTFGQLSQRLCKICEVGASHETINGYGDLALVLLGSQQRSLPQLSRPGVCPYFELQSRMRDAPSVLAERVLDNVVVEVLCWHQLFLYINLPNAATHELRSGI